MAPSTPTNDPRKDVSEEGRADQAKELTTYFDKVLSGLGDLGTDSSKIKHFQIGQMPETEIAELSIAFGDFEDGMVDTDVGCVPAPAVVDPCVWLDAQDNSTITLSGSSVIGWESKAVQNVDYESAGSFTPELVTVGGKQYLTFNHGSGTSRMGETAGTVENSCASRIGTSDFTVMAVFRSRDTDRGWIWGQDTDRRWFLRIAANGSDLEFNCDDNTTNLLLTATDVDFANDDVYVVFATKTGSFLRLYFGNGGALIESGDSPVAVPAGFGTLTQPTNSHLGARPSAVTPEALTGEIGELKMWSAEINATQRQSEYDTAVTYWAL